MADKIYIDVEFKLGKMKKASSEAAKHFEQASVKAAKKSESAFAKIGNSFKNTLNVATASMTFRAVNLLIDTFKEAAANAIGFNKAIGEINSLLPGFNTLNSQVVSTLKDLSAEYGKDRRDLAGAYYNIISAGVTNAADSLDLLQQATRASVAGLTEVNTASGAMLSVMQAYSGANVTAEEAAEKLFETVVIGRTRFEALAGSIGQVIPVASQAGATLDELLGFLGEATRTSGNTARTVTALRSAFNSILGPSDQAKKTIETLNKQLGINLEFSASALREKGMVTFLQEINEATLQFGNREEILKKLFGNVRGLTAILSVASTDTDKLAEAISRIENASELATSELENLNTFSGIWSVTLQRIMVPINFVTDGITFLAKETLLLANAFTFSGKAIDIQKKRVEEFFNWLLPTTGATEDFSGSLEGVEGAAGKAAKGMDGWFKSFGKGALVLKTAGDDVDSFIEDLTDMGGLNVGAIFKPMESLMEKTLTPEIKPNLDVDDELAKKMASSKAKLANFNALVFQKTKQTFEALGLNFAAIYDDKAGLAKIKALQEQVKANLNAEGLTVTPDMSEKDLTAFDEKLKTFQTNLQKKSPLGLLKEKGMEDIGDLSDSLMSLGGDLTLFSKQAKKNIAGTAAKAFSQGFAAMGAGAMNGSEMVKMAGRAMMDTFAEQMIAKGQLYMVDGAAMLFSGNPAGLGLIGQGAALSALGGMVSAKLGTGGGGGGISAGGVGGGGASGGGVVAAPPEFGPEVLEEQEPRTQINVNIEGNVLDSRESSLQIVDLINQAYNRDGVIVEQGI